MIPKKGQAEKADVKKKAAKEPTQVNPKGVRHKVLGANGKVRWEWKKS
jgi:hypothetical protein